MPWLGAPLPYSENSLLQCTHWNFLWRSSWGMRKSVKSLMGWPRRELGWDCLYRRSHTNVGRPPHTSHFRKAAIKTPVQPNSTNVANTQETPAAHHFGNHLYPAGQKKPNSTARKPPRRTKANLASMEQPRTHHEQAALTITLYGSQAGHLTLPFTCGEPSDQRERGSATGETACSASDLTAGKRHRPFVSGRGY